MMEKEPVHLHKDSIRLGESIIMGVAGTAPAFSMAATTGALIAAIGALSVASLFYSGLIVFGITLAFLHLNKINTNAGASYAWVGDIFHPILGFFAGWSLLVSSAMFMVSGTIPAANATLALLSPSLVNNTIIVTLVAAAWLILVSLIVIKGTKLAAIFQVIITLIEVVILVLIIGLIFYHYYSHPVEAFSWNELSLAGFTPETFSAGAIISLFFFWGWDVTLNLSEETENAQEDAGWGAIWSMAIVLALFMSFTVAAQLTLSVDEIQKAGTNIVFVLAEKVLPSPYSYLAVLAVMLSTVGTLETSIFQFTRTMFAKGRDGALHPRYAVLHSKWKTPWLATLVIMSIGLILLFFSSFSPSVNSIIAVSVNSIGLQVAFYYGLSGFACARLFWKEGTESVGKFISLVLWPFVSASFMMFIAIYAIKTFDWFTTVIGIGGIALGVIPLILNRIAKKQRGK
jgi:amino acid transporter